MENYKFSVNISRTSKPFHTGFSGVSSKGTIEANTFKGAVKLVRDHIKKTFDKELVIFNPLKENYKRI